MLIEQSAGDLMIVGHLPFLGKLAAALVGCGETDTVVRSQYAGVVCIDPSDGERSAG